MNKIDNKTYSLLEAVADIAYLAGQANFYHQDSRGDIALFIEWAQEFEAKYEGVIWGVNTNIDYPDAIYDFTTAKLRSCRLPS